ncbi:hypothetical protein TCAL_08676 [Tigriopus californicus]|uniref:MHD1 domain-containing protein n=1 Tax=Tigriopus californicus TaxID=6832 RepID=A0A553PDF3_TIGCA|nr:uncharacterized protein LOC131877198 [Tigriopus californicus]TRY75721.1 hypothetical protein TCAL_08676 [Tigriopus californicus]
MSSLSSRLKHCQHDALDLTSFVVLPMDDKRDQNDRQCQEIGSIPTFRDSLSFQLDLKSIEIMVHSFLNAHLQVYPSEIEEFAKYARREFNEILDEKVLGKITHPSNFQDIAKQVEISVEDIETSKVKKKDQLEYQLTLNGQTKVCVSDKRGGSDVKRLFLDCLEKDILKIMVHKYGHEGIKFVGQASLPLADVFGLGSQTLAITNTNHQRVGSIVVQSQVVFRDCDYAKNLVKQMVSDSWMAEICKVVGMKRNAPRCTMDSSEAQAVIRIEEEGQVSMSNALTTVINMNGEEYPMDANRNLDLDCTGLPNCRLRLECREQDPNSSPLKSNDSSFLSLMGLSLISSPNGSSNARMVFQQTIDPHAIGIRTGLQVTHAGLSWNIRWMELSKSDKISASNVEEALIAMTLDQIPENDWEGWNGSLIPSYYCIETLLHSVCGSHRFRSVKDHALLRVHATKTFNFNLVQDVLSRVGLSSGDQDVVISLVQNIGEYLAGIEFQSKIPVKNVKGCGACLDLLKENKDLLELFRTTYRRAYKSKIAPLMETRSVAEHRDFLLQHTIPILEVQMNSPGNFMNHLWATISSECIFECFLPTLEGLHLTGASGEVSFDIFRALRRLQHLQPEFQDRVFQVFKPCIDFWVTTIEMKGMEQVEKVLQFERALHDNQNWTTFCKSDSEWFEGAQDVKGILISCMTTWEQLDWPNLEVQTQFGLNLVQKLCSIFDHYINSLFEIVFADHFFDKHELVIIIFTLSSWAEYLDQINGKISRICQDLDWTSPTSKSLAINMEQFKATLGTAKFQVSEKALRFIDEFFVGEKTLINAFGKAGKLFDDSDSEDCLLGYINRELEFFNEYLKFDTEIVTKAYNQNICQRYFNLAEENFQEQFVKLKLKSRLKGNTEIFKPFLQALEELKAFETNLGITPSPPLSEIYKEVNTTFTPSAKLVSKHLQKIHDILEEDPKDPLGTIKFYAHRYEASEGSWSVELEFVALTDIKARNTSERTFKMLHSRGANIRLMISIPPLSTEKHPLRKATDIYVDMKDILFGFKSGTPHRFKFCIPQKAPISSDLGFVLIEMFDHSSMKTHKYFHGMTLIPLSDIPVSTDRNQDCVRTMTFQRVPKSEASLQWSEFVALKQRKDWTAKVYTKRHENRVFSHKKIVELVASDIKWIQTLDEEEDERK